MGYSIRDRLTKDWYVPLFAGLTTAGRLLPWNIYAPNSNVGGTATGPGGIGTGDGGFETPDDPTVNTPSITAPTCNATGVAMDSDATGSAFGSTNGQTHIASRWMIELLDDEGDLLSEGTGIIVYDSGVLPPGPLDFGMLNLKEGYSYRIRVRYKGSGGGWSAWSASCAFRMVGCAGELLIHFDMSDHSSYVGGYPGAGSNTWTHISNLGSANIQLKRSGGTGDTSPIVSASGTPDATNPWPGNSIQFTEGALLVTDATTDVPMDYGVNKVTMFFVGNGDLDASDYRAFTWHDKDRYVDIGSNEFGFHSTSATSRGFVNVYTGWGGDEAAMEGPNLGTGKQKGVIAATLDMTDPAGVFDGKLWYNSVQVCPGGGCASYETTFDPVDNPAFNFGALDAGGVSVHGGGIHQFAEIRVYDGILTDGQITAISDALKTKWGI